MRILVPFTTLRSETVDAILATGRPFETADVSASDEAYWHVLADLWRSGESFCIVEHDVVVNADTFDAFADCEHEWCAAPYPYFNGDYPGLGCVRFSEALTRRHPNVMEDVAALSDGSHPPMHWCRLDQWVRNVLMQKHRIVPCIHAPVGHARDGSGPIMPSHGCVTLEGRS